MSILLLPWIAGAFNEDPWGRAVNYLEQRGLQRIATAGPATWHDEADGAGLLLGKLDQFRGASRFTTRGAVYKVLHDARRNLREALACAGFGEVQT